MVAANSTLELARLTTTPPAGACALRVTVPVAVSPLPPVIVVGLRVTERIPGVWNAFKQTAHESAATNSKRVLLKEKLGQNGIRRSCMSHLVFISHHAPPH